VPCALSVISQKGLATLENIGLFARIQDVEHWSNAYRH
jgi:hypothetical protein